jgi:uncharacterized cupin superfamily protein
MIPNSQYLPLVGQLQGAKKIHMHLTTLETRGCIEHCQHSHQAEEAMYFLEGEAEYAAGETVHRVGPGDYLFFPAGVSHGVVHFFSERMKYLVVRSVEPNDELCCCEHCPR